MMQGHGVESQWTAEGENSRRSVPGMSGTIWLYRYAIVDGDVPDGFTLKRLRHGIPDDWDEQRRKFGFL